MKFDLKKIVLVSFILVFAILGFVNRESLARENLDALLLGLGLWAPFVYILIYSIAPVVFFPGTILTILSGFLFGPLWGTVYTMIGATIGSTLAFLVARYVARDWVEKQNITMLTSIKTKVEEQGWRFLAFARLLPVFPFTILNFAFGLTNMSAMTFAVTSFIFMTPLTFVYVYLGYVGQEASEGSQYLIGKLSVAVALLILASFLPKFFTRPLSKPKVSCDEAATKNAKSNGDSPIEER
ncbi:MAG: TVP38/TMEM64 family protein [Cyanobacteria bacterium]|nr:TVP38/TMEM64 family protein [Cyanobacteriota bacterium]MDA1020501.1 TVP38/TMEM64 family protein [Cyanobacteriota bacterium]